MKIGVSTSNEKNEKREKKTIYDIRHNYIVTYDFS